MTIALSRREFLKVSTALGGGLALEFWFPVASATTGGAAAIEVNAWIVIHPDDRVVIRIARSEMGQGTYTALAQLVAEELDCDWAKVSAEFASPNEHIRRNRIWGSMSTGGSMGVRSSQDYVRKAGASAREMLVAAAAAQWKVPAGECTAASGIIVHGPTGRKLRYGEVAAAAAKLAAPKDVTLRDPADWKIAGQPLHRLDIPDKVRGKPVFAVDVTLPGMLHASIAQCPVFGGKVANVDARAALGMRGVKKVVREENFVAVVADNWWRANEALKKVQIEWDAAGNGQADNRTIAAMLREGLADAKLPQARKLGDTQAGFAAAAKVVEAEYQSPYLNHATMEPQTCTAWLKPEGFLEVWTSTQNAEASMVAAAETAGLPLEKVEVHRLAAAAGKDPVDFRLAILKEGDKNRLVLEAVAKAAGWGSALPADVHRGVAVADGFGSYAAMVAEVSVSAAGEPRVHRIVVAIDSGYVVNPDTCRAQAESNVVFGLGSILYQEINVKDGRVVESNFHDFPLPRIAEMPKVETVLVPTGGFWGGHGEPAILPLTPAVCNAIFAATGKRVRSLPLKHYDLRGA